MANLVDPQRASSSDDDMAEPTFSSSCSISLKSSGSTTGISSMDTASERLRFVNSCGTLEDFFRVNESDVDEGNGSQSEDENDNNNVQVTLELTNSVSCSLNSLNLSPSRQDRPSSTIDVQTTNDDTNPSQDLPTPRPEIADEPKQSSEENVQSAEPSCEVNEPQSVHDAVDAQQEVVDAAEQQQTVDAEVQQQPVLDIEVQPEVVDVEVQQDDVDAEVQKEVADVDVEEEVAESDAQVAEKSVANAEEPEPQQPESSRRSLAPELEYDALAPLKHYLRPVCTIGTGTFGRVSLTRHRVTMTYYAIKALYIPTIIERRQVQHVHNEKRILQKLNHPFIVKLFDTAKDNRNLYMIMEFLAGGELFAYLRATKSFPSNFVKFYAVEVLLALEYLHGMEIAFRDLKPENLMLTQEGHVKLTDFGFAKVIHGKSYTLCGTAEYLAPELANRSGHNLCVDYWALGVLIFELMTGHPPFVGRDADDVQQTIVQLEGDPEFPKKTFSANCKNIVRSLLTIDPSNRLGSQGVQQIKGHAWFSETDWTAMLDLKVQPPLQPTVYHEGDTGNFDSYAEEESKHPAKQRDLDMFDEW